MPAACKIRSSCRTHPWARQRFNGQEFNWYQVPEELRQVDNIDLIIVDGPPQSLDPTGTPRYPALLAFIAQLSPKAMIYLDDANRPQEQEMIARRQYAGGRGVRMQ